VALHSCSVRSSLPPLSSACSGGEGSDLDDGEELVAVTAQLQARDDNTRCNEIAGGTMCQNSSYYCWYGTNGQVRCGKKQ
jgi:hypothetical protein